MNIQQLNNELGNIDLYLLDQLLKNRIPQNSRILDAGCGEGRNLMYFLQNGYNISGIDCNENAIRMLHFVLGSKFPSIPKKQFIVGDLNKLPYKNYAFDYIICSAVLHFATSHDLFWSMMSELNRVLATDGQLFIRMTGDIGITGFDTSDEGIADLPDGSTRYLITEHTIRLIKSKYKLQEAEPVKSVLVGHKRSMTTLVLQKTA